MLFRVPGGYRLLDNDNDDEMRLDHVAPIPHLICTQQSKMITITVVRIRELGEYFPQLS